MKFSRLMIVLLILVEALIAIPLIVQTYQARQVRTAMWEIIQPVALKQCTMGRWGRAFDGGYTVCLNLVDDIAAVYSYGIEGEDSFGCDASAALQVPVHQYDCFDTTRVTCATGGTPVFHEECVGRQTDVRDGRAFDSVVQQVQRNGHTGERLLVKMDIEGAEVESLLAMDEHELSWMNQLILEIHSVTDSETLALLQHLKGVFYIADVHYNNVACGEHHGPFPSSIVEVLLVNKHLDQIIPDQHPVHPNPVWRPNLPQRPDCQIAHR